MNTEPGDEAKTAHWPSSLFRVVLVQEAVQRGSGQQGEGGNEHDARIERKNAGKDLSCRRPDFDDRSHSAKQHRGVQKRIDPALHRKKMKSKHTQGNGCHHNFQHVSAMP